MSALFSASWKRRPRAIVAGRHFIACLGQFIQAAVAAHDPTAIDIAVMAGRHLGTAVANMVGALNIQTIVLVGRVTDLGDILLDAVQAELHQRVLPSIAETTTIRLSTLAPDQGRRHHYPRLLGAAAPARVGCTMSLRLGLDIGGTKTAALVVDESGAPLGRAIKPTDVTDPQRLVAGTLRIIDEALRDAGRDRSELLAAGIGIPGQVDPVDGSVRLAMNLNLREPYPLGQALQNALGIPVALENDVRTAAWGAYHWAYEQSPLNSLAYLSIGTGIAAGLVIGRAHLARSKRHGRRDRPYPHG